MKQISNFAIIIIIFFKEKYCSITIIIVFSFNMLYAHGSHCIIVKIFLLQESTPIQFSNSSSKSLVSENKSSDYHGHFTDESSRTLDTDNTVSDADLSVCILLILLLK